MNNKFLHDLQEDILERRGFYLPYMFVAIPFFIITIEEIKIGFDIVRFILSGTALLFLILIYSQCKRSRNEKENRIIIQNIFFFIILTFVSIYGFIKDFNF